jgi:hypothetical protein
VYLTGFWNLSVPVWKEVLGFENYQNDNYMFKKNTTLGNVVALANQDTVLFKSGELKLVHFQLL